MSAMRTGVVVREGPPTLPPCSHGPPQAARPPVGGTVGPPKTPTGSQPFSTPGCLVVHTLLVSSPAVLIHRPEEN